MTGADAEESSAWRQLGDGSDRMGGDGRKTRSGDGNPRAEPDARRVRRRERQGRITVRPDHLAVGRPGAVIAEIFQFLEDLPVVDLRRDHTAKFHALYSKRPRPSACNPRAALVEAPILGCKRVLCLPI